MKNDMMKYERVYRIIKNKIECGLIPAGTKLPSRAGLCEEFGISERTARRVVDMLEKEGLVEVVPKKRPVVKEGGDSLYEEAKQTMEKADSVAANDVLLSGILLCYPISARGMALCADVGAEIPEKIVARMDPDKPSEFWRLSNRLWRFFIARNENELILRSVDCLGLGDVDPLHGTREMRIKYLAELKNLLRAVRIGVKPANTIFDSVYPLYGIVLDNREGKPAYQVSMDSPLRIGSKGLGKELRKAQERYSSVYLDLLGLIATGRYLPGDRLPSHEKLQEIYNVSVDTTVKAIRNLQEWGVVTATRGKGIYVALDLEGLKKIHIDPNLIAGHVRRYLDSLELLRLTIEGVAAHAAASVTPEEARRFGRVLEKQWDGRYEHQLIPRTLLEFIVEHIRYDALRAIYEIILKNYSIGRSIPKLVSRDKTPESMEVYRQCIKMTGILETGDVKCFAGQTADLFQDINRQIVDLCKQLGYWEPAMQVYDGSELWR